MDEDFAIGLDLGTTNSCIGVFRNGNVEIIPNRMGERTTPSIVTILDGDIKIGEDTLDSLVKHYDKSIYEIKRFIGRKFSDQEVKEDINKLQYEMVSSDNGQFPSVKVVRNNKEKKYSPEEISSFIIKKMMSIAESYLHKPIKRAVITVPAYFNDAQRNLTKQAAELVNVKVERVLNEPTAAALAYGLDKGLGKNGEKVFKNILVFDLGGGTFDVSILNLKSEGNVAPVPTPIGDGVAPKSDGLFDVLATSGDSHLGGEDFDNVLVDHFLKEFCIKMKIPENEIVKDKQKMKRLKINCESIKRDLSKAEETVLCIDNFHEKKDILEKITRKQFEKLSQGLFERLNTPVDTALVKAELRKDQIDEVLLIGGSTRIPKIKEMLKEKFPNSTINDSINPDEAVAYGATLYAAKIMLKSDDTVKGISFLDICPFSLGTDIMNRSKDPEEIAQGKKMSFIIKKGSRIPCDKSETYRTVVDNQPKILIEIYEGENNYVKYNHYLGKILLTNLPKKPAGQVAVIVKYNIDVNGIFTATAEEKSTGIKECKVVNDKVHLSEEEIKELQEKNKDDYLKQEGVVSALEDYRKLKEDLDMFENTYNNAEDQEDKVGAILNYNDKLEEFINNFDKDNFDNEIILEKYFNYIHQLFSSYAKTLNLGLEKEDKDEIVKKIKKYLDIFKNRSFGYIIKLLDEIKGIKRDIFYDIVIYTMEMMNNCGKECLKTIKEFCRYHSIVFFEDTLRLAKTYIDEKKLASIRDKGKTAQRYKDHLEESKKYLNNINNHSILVLQQSKMVGKLIQRNSGFTYFLGGLRVEDKASRENMEIVLANYERMLREIKIEEKREFTEEEAICIANIIKINFKFLGNAQYERYLRLAEDCEFVVSRLKDFNPKTEWYLEFKELTKKIKENDDSKKVYANLAVEQCRRNYPDVFSKIDNCAADKDHMKFINYILEKHPYKGYDEDKAKNKINFNVYTKELVDYLCQKYHPDNYELTNDEAIKKRFAEIHVISSKLSGLFSDFK